MKCLNCNKDFEPTYKGKKCCSRSCGVSYGNKNRKPRTEASKAKTSKTLKDNASTLSKLDRAIKNNSKCILKWTNCKICDTIILHKSGIQKNYCSDKCRNIQRSQTAIKQLKKGNGKKGYYKGVWCDSTYELVFVIYHIENNIAIQRCLETFPYIFDNKPHTYNPDFIVDNIIYEIKGYMNERAKIKHDAANEIKDVVLLRKNDLKPYFDFVKDKFNIPITRLHTLYDDNVIISKKCKNCNKEYNSNNKTFCSIKCSGEFRFNVNCVLNEEGRFKKND